MYGLTPMSTIRAPVTAFRFAFGSSAVASDVTIPPCSAAAFSAVRLVTRMPPVTVTSGDFRPLRMAPPIEPAPRIAMVGSFIGIRAF